MYQILSTGSKGNAIIYFKSILLDCGVPFSLIKPFLKDIKIVLFSHVHGDHFNIKTVRKLAAERPTLRFGCGKWMLPHIEGIKNVDVYEFGKWYDYGEFKISIGKSYHDVENCFFRIEKNGYKIFHATDTNHLEGITAKGYDLYMIEANYDSETVYDTIRSLQEQGKYAHQIGAINSHLSFQQANDFFYANKGEHSKLIRLHESKSF